MTIDEAIEEELFMSKMDDEDRCYVKPEYHEQLAEWLEELKELRKISFGYNKEDIELNRKAMYDRAIDDLLNKVLEKGIIGLVQYNEICKIAEQLKEGD